MVLFLFHVLEEISVCIVDKYVVKSQQILFSYS